jgi:metal-sulfur cluster biosynthetic enzyme/ribosomal protein L22
MTTLGLLTAREPQARVVTAEARAALDTVSGLPVVEAVAKLRFGPGRTCEPVARVIDKALAMAERAGITADKLVVVGGSVRPAEDIVRVRRKAHGTADWIASPTSEVSVRLQPLNLTGSAAFDSEPAPGPVTPPPVTPQPDSARARAVREVLYDVIDPDLGVNIVDLGFVRSIQVNEHRVAAITMTLTSAACPLTQVMTDQIRSALLGGEHELVSDFLVEWSWLPAWRPADISEDGREQLRAIGFTNL